ncbi:unnamed protein product [Mytilus coruscus]|uniref:Uncharacterized protein n=1 Tax=Mytilus coruscus TaxID=42192 RepID=A0A6J8EAX3_MYTCO|nr:unnamed protein product [Mytilus coruscus]
MSDHADLSDLSKFDLSINHADYPKECIPDKLNNPSTKAKQLFFEEINDIYEPEANQVAFKVSCDRIPIWIKSLSLLYYDIYGKMKFQDQLVQGAHKDTFTQRDFPKLKHLVKCIMDKNNISSNQIHDTPTASDMDLDDQTLSKFLVNDKTNDQPKLTGDTSPHCISPSNINDMTTRL